MSRMSFYSKGGDVDDKSSGFNKMVNQGYRMEDREFNPTIRGWGKMIQT